MELSLELPKKGAREKLKGSFLRTMLPEDWGLSVYAPISILLPVPRYG
jgi:hypothetical protein